MMGKCGIMIVDNFLINERLLKTEAIILDNVLNHVNMLSDTKAQYLKEIDNYNMDAERHLCLYTSYKDELIAIGYEGEQLVWFSRTDTNDLLSSRRIFECMKQSKFYRYAALSEVLAYEKLFVSDLEHMGYTRLDNIQSAKPVFSGCIVGNRFEQNMTGTDFAAVMISLPNEMKKLITKIGSDDEIIVELEKDYQIAAFFYNSGKDKSKIEQIRNKWTKAECLKYSNRASIRSRYYDICYKMV